MVRGRDAETPTEIPAKGWKDILWRVKDEIAEDRVGLIAAGVAFYGLLALFPALSAVLAIAGLVMDPQQVTEQIRQLEGVVPSQVLEIITNQTKEVAGANSGGLGLAAVAGLLIALYSASKGTGSLMQGMNVAYDETESRSFFKKIAVQLGLTLFLILGIVIGLAATVVVPAILSLLNESRMVETIGTIIAWSIMFVLSIFGLGFFYAFAPDRDRPEFRWVTPGALTACILWLIASAGFGFYVANFGTYNESFGALAGVVVMLMWFWMSAFIVLLGAELNAEAEAQTRKDTTVGYNEPTNGREAVKTNEAGETLNA